MTICYRVKEKWHKRNDSPSLKTRNCTIINIIIIIIIIIITIIIITSGTGKQYYNNNTPLIKLEPVL